MSAKQTYHEWSKEALLIKAQRYSEIMLKQERSDWQFGFWSSLTLEILTRASLSNISPALVADGKDWNNIFYSLGHTPNTSKFKPCSANISELFSRVENIFPKFTKEMKDFSLVHINRRNSELHTGALPFDELGSSAWLPKFYSCVEVLLETLGESLELLLGVEETKAARTQIQALQDNAAEAVKGDIKAHMTVWQAKDNVEREKLAKQAETLASRHIGHRVACPSCNSVSLIQGSPCGAPSQDLEDDIIVEKQPILPSLFECTACRLKISGYSKLNACGLGDTYTTTSRYDASEYFGVDPEGEWYGMEDDNNEP